MNNEIKEILDKLKEIKEPEIYITPKTTKKLLHYITNLQHENNNLKTSLDESQEVVIDLQQENEKLKEENKRLKELDENYPIEEELAEAYRREEDYKSRIEKAVEYINYYGITPEQNDDTTCRHILKSLLDILNGRSDE